MPKVRFGDEEIRTNDNYPDPFPLYPHEKLEGKIEKTSVILVHSALKLKARRDVLVDGKKRIAGEEWFKPGPCSYIPEVDVNILDTITATVIKPNTALKIKALKNSQDKYGIERKAGEKWLIRESGAYLP